MDSGDITLIILLTLLLVMWIGGEIHFRKSKDAKWIKKARGNKSVRKYRESVIGRKLSHIEKWGILDEIEKKQFSDVEQEQQFKKAYKREERRFLCRSVLWFMIILMLGCYIYYGGKY